MLLEEGFERRQAGADYGDLAFEMPKRGVRGFACLGGVLVGCLVGRGQRLGRWKGWLGRTYERMATLRVLYMESASDSAGTRRTRRAMLRKPTLMETLVMRFYWRYGERQRREDETYATYMEPVIITRITPIFCLRGKTTAQSIGTGSASIMKSVKMLTLPVATVHWTRLFLQCGFMMLH